MKQAVSSVLVIGDSNTESGRITENLKRAFNGAGDSGTGFWTMNENAGPVKPSSFSINCGPEWKPLDMHDGVRLSPPHLSPNGMWIESAVPGAGVTVTFAGDTADIYWLSAPGGGEFAVESRGRELIRVDTSGSLSICKTTVILSAGGATDGLRLRVVRGPVALIGIDAYTGQNRGIAVHNWGNAWSSTFDFLNIEEEVFATGLQAVTPDVVVILLGSNDHNLDERPAAEFKANLIRLIRRVKAAAPSARILLTSTFVTNSESARRILPQYTASSYPEAAAEENVDYWDLSAWFGPFDPSRLPDGYHCSEAAGRMIAEELYVRIISLTGAE